MATPIAEAVVKVRADTSTFKQDVQSKTTDALGAAKAQASAAEKEFAKLVIAQRDATIQGQKLGITNAQIAATTTELLVSTRELAKQEYLAARALGAEGAAAAEAAFATFTLVDAQLAAAASAQTLGGQAGQLGQIFGRIGGREAAAGLGAFAGKAGLIGLAAAAGFQAISKLTEALKVDGDAAFTTEGKLRNAGAAILSADVIGAFQALNAEVHRVTFKELIAEGDVSAVTLRNFAQEASASAAEARRLAPGLDAMGIAASEAAVELDKDAASALNMATAMENAASAVLSVELALARAGSEAAAFGERANSLGLRGPGGVALEAPLFSGSPVDESDTKANAAAIRDAQADATRTRKDDLANAKADLAEAQRLEERDKSLTNGRLARRRAVVEAERDVAQIEQQIQDDALAAQKRADAEAAAAQRERDRLAKEEAARRKKEREDRAKAYRADIALDLQRIKNEQAAADLDGKVTKADIDAKKKEIALYARLSKDRKNLTALERAEFQGAKINAQKELRELLGQNDKGGGLTAESLFQTAVSNFGKFGSNIAADWGGVLSPQDARGALAGSLLAGKKTTSTSAGRAAANVTNNPVATVIASTAQAESQRSSKILVELQTQTGLLRKIAGSTRNLSVGINGGRVVNAQGTEWVGPRRY